MLVASAHICLAACQTAPGALLPPPPGGASLLASTPATATAPAPANNSAAPTPYMRCVNDFWGNCTGVASNRHDYRWRYVRPGARPRELRESATARASINEKEPVREKGGAVRENAVLRDPPPVRENAVVREKVPVRENVVNAPAPPPVRENAVVREKAPVRENVVNAPAAREKPPAREKIVRDTTVMSRDKTLVCHGRRRVVGEERPSQDDARRAAENGWMGSVRYDFGERYQDINRAKDVRLNCGPSSVSIALKTPHFRCAVEATPCRDTQGYQGEPDERRYDPPVREDQISRK